MKPKEMFTIAVRLLGLVFLYQGLRAAPGAVAGFLAGILALHPADMVVGLLAAGWPLLLAFWLLRGAPFLVRLAFRERRQLDEPVPEGVAIPQKT